MSRKKAIVLVNQNWLEVLECGHFGKHRIPGRAYFDRIRVCHECPNALTRKEVGERRMQKIKKEKLCYACGLGNDNLPRGLCKTCEFKRRETRPSEARVSV